MNSSVASLGRGVLNLETQLKRTLLEFRNRQALDNYLKSDRRPWRSGYHQYRRKYIADQILGSTGLDKFLSPKSLPAGYGYRLDARVVEIPWALARAGQRNGYLLDAGASLNHDFVLTAPALENHKITIITLAPEATCLWKLGISYVFGDLRNMYFRDEEFDSVICISTIEHVGMDNSMYAGEDGAPQSRNPKEFLSAIAELERVLKPGGVLYITFPFGRYEDHGWFQQFDSELVDTLIEGFGPTNFKETIFRYEPDGWKLSDRASCAHCQFFDVHTSKYFDPQSTIDFPVDYPAGERAVACLELYK